MNSTKLGYIEYTKQLLNFSTAEVRMGSITIIRQLDYVDVNTYIHRYKNT